MNVGIRGLHPFTLFAYFMGFVFLSMMLLHPVYLLSGIILVIILNLYVDRGRELRSYLPYYLLTGLAVWLLNPLFSHRGRVILTYFMDQPITLESILYGLITMLSLMCILMSFVVYNQVMTSGKFLFLFSKAFQKIGLLVMMAVRFVPLVKRRMGQIMLVQKTRGVNPFQGSLKKRFQDAVLILQILVTWSLEEALQTSDSMKARGYGILGKRGSYHPYRFCRMDLLALAVMACTGLICFWGWAEGYGVLPIYPKLKWPSFYGIQSCIFISYLLFTAVPIFIEEKERVRWRSLK